MDFAFTPEQEALRESIGRIVAGFDERYWLERDQTATFPYTFTEAVAAGGWLGIAMPEEFGGAALG